MRHMLFILLLCLALPAQAQLSEPAYDRVMKSSTLRCGYALWPKWVEKDPNTGRMSGAWAEYVEAAAGILGWKVEWAAEVNMGDFAPALASGKIDAYCLAMAATDARLRAAYFTTPAIYAAFHAYARADDDRFTSLTSMNRPEVRVAAMEGDETGIMAKRRLPQATIAELPGLAGGADMLLSVATGKADIALTDPGAVKHFNAANKVQLKRVETDGPLAVFGGTLALGMGENRLLTMLNGATRDLLDSGVIGHLMARYDFQPGLDYLPVAGPYLQ